METFSQAIIEGLIQITLTALLVLAGVWGVLRKRLKNNNGCSVDVEKEFHDQVKTCDQRFIEIAKNTGAVNTSIQNIEKSVDEIKTTMYRRRK